MADRSASVRATGGCLCGTVRYEIRGPLRPPLECHCRTCRRFTGGLWHATAARREDVSIQDGGSLAWYGSSPQVSRGFCRGCGSKLFYDHAERPYLGVTMGTLDEPTGMRLSARIWRQEAADYYVLGDAVRTVPDGNHGHADPAAWAEGRLGGACLCGGVRYELAGPLRPVLECHCHSCRRITGGLWNATAAMREQAVVHDGGTLSWYQSSARGRRGYCGTCGSSLFGDHEVRPFLVVTAGTLHEPTGLKLATRIFTAETGDYHVIADDVPTIVDNRHGLTIPDA